MSGGNLESPPWGDALTKAGAKIADSWQNWFLGLLTRINAGQQTVGTVNLTGRGATIATTTVPGTADSPVGLYRLGYFLRCTTVGGVSSSFTLTLGWTDGGVAQTETFAAVNGNTTTTQQNACRFVKSDANIGISYTVVYASNPAGAARFELAVKVETIS